jgi:hypothetical protein
MNSAPSCPLCDRPVERQVGPDQYWDIGIICKRCGRFKIHYDTPIKDDEKYLLSAVCRRWAAGGLPTIGPTNVASLLSQAPRFTVLEKLDQLLVLAGQKTEKIGDNSTLNLEDDYPLLVARDPNETNYLASALRDRGFIVIEGTTIRLTVSGWERIDQMRQTGRTSSLAFVAMWFDESTNALYNDAIEPAIREAHYEPLRIDKHPHLNRIDDEIVGQIRRSRFMVADFTGQRPGVYFETGFMMGLGRNVFWMCSKDEIEKGIHFDVRQYNFIIWESPQDARVQLRNRVLRIEGEGPRALIS